MEPKLGQDGAKIIQNRAKMGPRGPEMEPKWGQDGEKITKKRQHNKHVYVLYVGPPILTEIGANMDPTWVSK